MEMIIVSYSDLYDATVDHLVLIGAPIQQSLLNCIKKAKHINNVIIIDLSNKGDPIRAGMSNWDIVTSTPTLAGQFFDDKGHFWYALMTPEGSIRRRELARDLYNRGLR